MKLFMFYVGGSCGNSNIELHDVRFSIGDTAKDCHDNLREQWWGSPSSFHLDCWGEVEQADGFDVTIQEGATDQVAEKLFLVNMGGYDLTQFGELHKNLLVVAPNVKQAATKALATVQGWALPHRDNVFDVDNAVDVTKQIGKLGYSIRLTRAAIEKRFEFTSGLLWLGVGKDPTGTAPGDYLDASKFV